MIPGQPDPDPEHLRPLDACKSEDGAGGLADDVDRSRRLVDEDDGHLRAGDDARVEVAHDRRQPVAPQLDPDDVAGERVEPQQHGRAPAVRGRGGDLNEDPALEEAPDDRGHGWSADSALTRQLGAGDRTATRAAPVSRSKNSIRLVSKANWTRSPGLTFSLGSNLAMKSVWRCVPSSSALSAEVDSDAPSAPTDVASA